MNLGNEFYYLVGCVVHLVRKVLIFWRNLLPNICRIEEILILKMDAALCCVWLGHVSQKWR
jgi:hypothetical protein